jgi:hypothetical protein
MMCECASTIGKSDTLGLTILILWEGLKQTKPIFTQNVKFRDLRENGRFFQLMFQRKKVVSRQKKRALFVLHVSMFLSKLRKKDNFLQIFGLSQKKQKGLELHL